MKLSLDKTKTIVVPEDPDGATIKIKALNLDVIAAIEAKSTTTTMNLNGDGVVALDDYKRVNEIARACLCDWNGFFDETGSPVVFSRKNLASLAKFSIDSKTRFFSWVDEEHSKFLDELETIKEDTAKN